MLSIPILTSDKPGATKDRNLRSFYVSVSHAEGGAYVISGPVWGLPSRCSPRRLFRHHISRVLPRSESLRREDVLSALSRRARARAPVQDRLGSRADGF